MGREERGGSLSFALYEEKEKSASMTRPAAVFQWHTYAEHGSDPHRLAVHRFLADFLLFRRRQLIIFRLRSRFCYELSRTG